VWVGCVVLRVFRCENCDHRLRYGAKECGRCRTPTAAYNQYWVVWLGIVVVIGLFVLILSTL